MAARQSRRRGIRPWFLCAMAVPFVLALVIGILPDPTKAYADRPIPQIHAATPQMWLLLGALCYVGITTFLTILIDLIATARHKVKGG